LIDESIALGNVWNLLENAASQFSEQARYSIISQRKFQRIFVRKMERSESKDEIYSKMEERELRRLQGFRVTY
jgi:hypothetical protein